MKEKQTKTKELNHQYYNLPSFCIWNNQFLQTVSRREYCVLSNSEKEGEKEKERDREERQKDRKKEEKRL